MEGLAQSIDMLIDMLGKKKEYLEHYDKRLKEYNEQQKAQETHGDDVGENQEDEGLRTEGIREEA